MQVHIIGNKHNAVRTAYRIGQRDLLCQGMLLFALTALATLDKANGDKNEGAWGAGAIAGVSFAAVVVIGLFAFWCWTMACHSSKQPFAATNPDKFFVAPDSSRESETGA